MKEIVNRYLADPVNLDLEDRKMVFIGGPRQVGKTTLSTQLLGRRYSPLAYLNWDNRQDRKSIQQSAWPGDANLIVLDELHKYRQWKSFIKGEYDTLKDKYLFVLTGSARMDVFRRGGDSLQGRYHYYRLHPFSLAEVNGYSQNQECMSELHFPERFDEEGLQRLLRFGGFPEPFIKAQDRFIRRWHNEKVDRLFREDIQDLEPIRNIGGIKMLSDMLPDRIGSLLSTNGIREDLEVSFRAVSHWLDILETFYYHFRIYPHSTKNVRSLKKEPKLYLWDWSEVPDQAARFENAIASHLLKYIHYLHDFEGYNAELRFMRDLAKNEVDFLVVINRKPWFAVEVKRNDIRPAKSLQLFRKKWEVPFCYQVINTPSVDTFTNGIRIISASRFLLGLV